MKAKLLLYRSAKQDLEKYLQLSPEAKDREEILEHLDDIRMRLERLQ